MLTSLEGPRSENPISGQLAWQSGAAVPTVAFLQDAKLLAGMTRRPPGGGTSPLPGEPNPTSQGDESCGAGAVEPDAQGGKPRGQRVTTLTALNCRAFTTPSLLQELNIGLNRKPPRRGRPPWRGWRPPRSPPSSQRSLSRQPATLSSLHPRVSDNGRWIEGLACSLPFQLQLLRRWSRVPAVVRCLAHQTSSN